MGSKAESESTVTLSSCLVSKGIHEKDYRDLTLDLLSKRKIKPKRQFDKGRQRERKM